MFAVYVPAGLPRRLLVCDAGMLYCILSVRSMIGSAFWISCWAVVDSVTVFTPVCPVIGPIRNTLNGMLLTPEVKLEEVARTYKL